jgi:argininosuccinate lyase
MPQKKNPDVAELVRGKTGRVYGDLIGLLTVMKGLPLAYNKDMQEDKEPVFDAIDTVEMCLPVFSAMIRTMTVLPDHMRQAAETGFLNATDCADYLTRKDVPFRDAYTIVGRLVADCSARGKTLEQLTLTELQAVSPLFQEDIYPALALKNCAEQRRSYGGPAKSETTRQIAAIRDFVTAHRQAHP